LDGKSLTNVFGRAWPRTPDLQPKRNSGVLAARLFGGVII
jgi:hypothetical protein